MGQKEVRNKISIYETINQRNGMQQVHLFSV